MAKFETMMKEKIAKTDDIIVPLAFIEFKKFLQSKQTSRLRKEIQAIEKELDSHVFCSAKQMFEKRKNDALKDMVDKFFELKEAQEKQGEGGDLAQSDKVETMVNSSPGSNSPKQ